MANAAQKADDAAQVAAAVAAADHFIASVFKGVGEYEKEQAPDLRSARDLGRAMSVRIANGRPALIYAVVNHPERGEVATLVPNEFVPEGAEFDQEIPEVLQRTRVGDAYRKRIPLAGKLPPVTAASKIAQATRINMRSAPDAETKGSFVDFKTAPSVEEILADTRHLSPEERAIKREARIIYQEWGVKPGQLGKRPSLKSIENRLRREAKRAAKAKARADKKAARDAKIAAAKAAKKAKAKQKAEAKAQTSKASALDAINQAMKETKPMATKSKKTAKKKAPKKAKTKIKRPGHPNPGGGKPLGVRAQAEFDAQNGKMPAAPDFSAETHKRFRPLLKEVVDAAKAGDIAALKKIKINPISSSPKAVDRYRNLCVMALEAKAKG